MASNAKEQKSRKKQIRIKKDEHVVAKKEESPFGELIKLINFEDTYPTEDNIDLLLTKPPVHKSEAGINPLVDAAAYVFSSMGQLARMRSRHDLAELQKKLIEEINEFQKSVKELNYKHEYLSEYIPIATYALSSTLDDIIAHTSWGGQGKWDKYSLLHAFHQEALSRDNFLIILERFIQDQDIFIDVMELIYICLNLGFKYSSHSSGFGAEQLQGIMHSLYKRIRIYRGNFNKILFPYPLKTSSTRSSVNKSRITRYLKSKFTKTRQLPSMHPALIEQVANTQNRFANFLDFLENRSIIFKGKKVQLSSLPWLLVVGMPDSGKTTLIENSKIKFVISKNNNPDENSLSDNWDWWITAGSVILDIPGNFQAWKELLDSISLNRGATGANSIAMVISYAEIMDKSTHLAMIAKLGNDMADLQSRFGKDLPLNLIINKCDLIPGFAEFFDDYTGDELSQPWGMRLSLPGENQTLSDIFYNKFDLLIKQLNSQIIYRLHQEKDFRYQEKFRIKDFPLQLEQLKNNLGEIIKVLCNENIHFSLNGVFLTSAMQTATHDQESQLPQIISSEKLLQNLSIMHVPTITSQSYFIKQMLLNGLLTGQNEDGTSQPAGNNNWLNFLNKQIRGI